MAYTKEIVNKNGSISYKTRVKYKGVFETKTFPVKGKRKKTVEGEAKAWGLEIEKQIDEGTYRKPEKKKNYTVKQALEKYIADGNPKVKNEKDKKKIINALEWFKKEIGSLPLKSVERSDIKACRDKLKKKHKEVPIKGSPGKGKKTDEYISESTVKHYIDYFSAFLTYCVTEYEILDRNPRHGAKLQLGKSRSRERWLKSLNEITTLLEECKNKDYELYLCTLFALTTGARKSEILKLTWDNTNLESKAIYFLDTKNGENRTIPIPDILYKELLELRRLDNVIKIKDKPKDNYLFKTPEGKPKYRLIEKLYPDVVSMWSEKYEYEKITFHGLRHTYTSKAFETGINLFILQKIVGHKTTSVTGGYTHADCESLREPINRIAQYMLTGKQRKEETEEYTREKQEL